MPNTYEWDYNEAVLSGLWKFSPDVSLKSSRKLPSSGRSRIFLPEVAGNRFTLAVSVRMALWASVSVTDFKASSILTR